MLFHCDKTCCLVYCNEAMLFLLTKGACQKDMCTDKDSYWPTPANNVHNYCNETF